MKPSYYVQIRHLRGGFFGTNHKERRYFVARWPDEGWWGVREEAERFLASKPEGVAVDQFEIVPAEFRCGCCGMTTFALKMVEQAYGRRTYRCEKHVGRFPCDYEGCGRTWRLDEGESYWVAALCRQHWQLGPLRMRRAVDRVRRMIAKAKRRGLPIEDLEERRSRLWRRVHREITKSPELDPAEINRVMGWD